MNLPEHIRSLFNAKLGIGLATMVANRHEVIGATVTAIIFASVIIYETIWSPATRLVLKLADEMKVS